MSVSPVYEGFCEYLFTRCQQKIYNVLQQDVRHATILVDIMDVLDVAPALAHNLVQAPAMVIPEVNAAALSVQQRVAALFPDERLHLKEALHMRFTHLPSVFGHRNMASVRSGDAGQLMTIVGTVVRVSDKRVVESSKWVQCTKCGCEILARSDITQKYKLCTPSRCTSRKCKGYAFRDLPRVTWMDVQELRIRDTKCTGGVVPAVMTVVLEHELVDQVKPGEDIAVICYPFLQWQAVLQDCVCSQEIVLMAVGVSVVPKHAIGVGCRPSEIITLTTIEERNQFVDGLFGDIKGCFVVKLAMALLLVGGVRAERPDGVTLRGESHILLVGDPGTGKTQILHRALDLAGRGVFATGVGSTLAGLTATAVKEGGEWHLEAGALVLSDSGVCCIDEFNTLREQERASLLEAMEQQSVSIAKAGIVIRLPARCNVIAACTAKNAGDAVAFSLPLLSRFDVVFVIRDVPNKEWDDYIAKCVQIGGAERETTSRTDAFRKYVDYVRNTITPESLPDEVQNLIAAHYHKMRGVHAGTSHAVTTRSLEALIRLTQAHARLMCRSEVVLDDAIAAIYVMEHSLHAAGVLDNVHVVHTTPPSAADAETMKKRVMSRLGLSPDGLTHTSVSRGPSQDPANFLQLVSGVPSFPSGDSHITPERFRPEDPATSPRRGTQQQQQHTIQQPRAQSGHRGSSSERMGAHVLTYTDESRNTPQKVNGEGDPSLEPSPQHVAPLPVMPSQSAGFVLPDIVPPSMRQPTPAPSQQQQQPRGGSLAALLERAKFDPRASNDDILTRFRGGSRKK